MCYERASCTILISARETNLRALGGPPLLPRGNVAFRKPPASLHKLHDIDHLLAKHDREAETRKDPRDRAVHFVGAGQLHCSCGPGVREEYAWLWRRWGPVEDGGRGLEELW